MTNADVRAWAARLHAGGLSASSVRKAVFALRRILAAGVADRRLAHNPADDVPLPADESGEQRFLTAAEVEALAGAIDPRFRTMVLVTAYGGLQFVELAGLRRARVDVLRGRVEVVETLVRVGAELTLGPTKTRKGRRTVPLPRRVMGELAAHQDARVPAQADALVFTGLFGQPLRREWFRRTWWLPAVRAAGHEGLRLHDEPRQSAAHVRVVADPRGREREGGLDVGRSLLGRVHPRSLRAPVRRRGRLDADRLDALLHATRPAPDAPVLPLPTASEGSR